MVASNSEGIIPYNPRSRQFLSEEEIAVVGAFISIIDPTLQGLQYIHEGQLIRDNLENQIRQWISEYRRIALTSYELYLYVTRSQLHIYDKPPVKITIINGRNILSNTLSSTIYRLER